MSITSRLDYKEEYKDFLSNIKYITWRSKNVVNAVEDCLLAKYAPRRVLVGLDAKYFFPLANLLSTGIGFAAIQELPALMKK